MYVERSETVTATSINDDNRQDKPSNLMEEYPFFIVAEFNYIKDMAKKITSRIQSKIGTIIGNTKNELHKFFENL